MGEGFQLDSSLSYHSGDNEGIEGGLDVVIPLWNGGRHAIFTQPGFVFWTGIEKEERIDGNIGLVYRAEIARDLIAGASVFYDHDFQIGHSRVSGGIDLQSGFFRFGANYYHVLSEIEDGREGFVEEAVDGIDARLVFEREVVRLGGTVGYWDYEGEESSGGENSQSGWQTSIGLDAGVRILPGVFAEASWERHKDDLVLDERIFAGLAFRFSLPEFEGASYGDGSMSTNLYKIVDREKRILYEERVKGTSVSLDLPEGVSASVGEGGDPIELDIRLSEELAEDVTINLVGTGSATYGADGDYTVSVGNMTCTAVTEDNCQVTIAMGETSSDDNVVITINDDGRTNEPAETIILSMVIDSPDDTPDLMLGNSNLSFTIPADPPLPAVSISATSRNIAEGGSATLTATLTERLTEDVVINLLEGGAADYGTGMDWHLNNGSDCNTATGTSCQITIAAGQPFATVTVNVNTDQNIESPNETFTVSVDIASPDSTVVVEGSPSSLSFTIEDVPPPTVSINYSGSTTLQEPGTLGSQSGTGWATIELSRALTEEVVINIVAGGGASYGPSLSGKDWHVRVQPVSADGMPDTTSDLPLDTACASATAAGTCQASFAASVTIVQVQIIVSADVIFPESEETFTLSINIASAGSTDLVNGSPSTLMFTIPANNT